MPKKALGVLSNPRKWAIPNTKKTTKDKRPKGLCNALNFVDRACNVLFFLAVSQRCHSTWCLRMVHEPYLRSLYLLYKEGGDILKENGSQSRYRWKFNHFPTKIIYLRKTTDHVLISTPIKPSSINSLRQSESYAPSLCTCGTYPLRFRGFGPTWNHWD